MTRGTPIDGKPHNEDIFEISEIPSARRKCLGAELTLVFVGDLKRVGKWDAKDVHGDSSQTFFPYSIYTHPPSRRAFCAKNLPPHTELAS